MFATNVIKARARFQSENQSAGARIRAHLSIARERLVQVARARIVERQPLLRRLGVI